MGVWRVRAGGESRVLKHLRLGAGSDANAVWRSEPEIDSPFYWRREVEFYESSLLAAGPFGLPRREIFDRPDGSVALWLEDLGAPGAWTIEEIADIAARLASLRAPLDPPRWLARGWLRRYLEVRASRFGPGLPVWRRRDAILERIQAGSPVLTHNDFHPGNIFRVTRGPVVIDWAFCGLGVPGEDAGVLAADFLFDEIIPVDRAGELIDAVWAAYSGELEPALVAEAEFAYFAGNALRYGWAAEWNQHFAQVYRALSAAAETTLRSFA